MARSPRSRAGRRARLLPLRARPGSGVRRVSSPSPYHARFAGRRFEGQEHARPVRGRTERDRGRALDAGRAQREGVLGHGAQGGRSRRPQGRAHPLRPPDRPREDVPQQGLEIGLGAQVGEGDAVVAEGGRGRGGVLQLRKARAKPASASPTARRAAASSRVSGSRPSSPPDHGDGQGHLVARDDEQPLESEAALPGLSPGRDAPGAREPRPYEQQHALPDLRSRLRRRPPPGAASDRRSPVPEGFSADAWRAAATPPGRARPWRCRRAPAAPPRPREGPRPRPRRAARSRRPRRRTRRDGRSGPRRSPRTGRSLARGARAAPPPRRRAHGTRPSRSIGRSARASVHSATACSMRARFLGPAVGGLKVGRLRRVGAPPEEDAVASGRAGPGLGERRVAPEDERPHAPSPEEQRAAAA